MSVLLMRLAGPLQAWGATSRYVRRTTEAAPTKSGVIGMLAAATGRRRTDPIEDLVRLKFAVRTDQPGEMLRDFQTTRSLDGANQFPLSERYYLSDAVFVVGLQGDGELVAGLGEALVQPRYALFLGRRSCVPSRPVVIGIDNERPLVDAVGAVPWQAAGWWQRQATDGRAALPLAWDAAPGERADQTLRDHPVSYDPELRDYGWRDVRHGSVDVVPTYSRAVRRRAPRPLRAHDPFELLPGA